MKKVILISLVLLMNFIYQGRSSAEETVQSIGIVVFDGVLTSEVAAPVEVFGYEDSGFRTYLISEKKGIVRTQEGLKLEVDFSFSDSPDLNVLIVPSSYDVEGIMNNEAIVSYVRTQAQKADYLASNCAGAYIMGAAGLLDHRQVVTYVGGGTGLQEKFPDARVQDDEQHNIMVDGNYVSSNVGLVSYEAAFKLLEMLKGKSVADARKEETYYNRLVQ